MFENEMFLLMGSP